MEEKIRRFKICDQQEVLGYADTYKDLLLLYKEIYAEKQCKLQIFEYDTGKYRLRCNK